MSHAAGTASLSVRLFAVTGGRVRTPRSADLQLHDCFEPGRGQPPPGAVPEARTIVELCSTRRRSLAELAGRVDLPVPVVAVLVSDLLDADALAVPYTTHSTTTETLRALADALRERFADDRAVG